MVTKLEAKKHGYRQTKDGVVVSFVLHPNDVDAALAAAPLGTSYVLGIVEIEAGLSPEPETVSQVDVAVSGAGSQGWDAMPFTQQAGIRCNDHAFQHWIGASDAKDAAERIRSYCKVESRKHLVRGTQAGERWTHMDNDFRAFQTSQQYQDYSR